MLSGAQRGLSKATLAAKEPSAAPAGTGSEDLKGPAPLGSKLPVLQLDHRQLFVGQNSLGHLVT